MIIVFTDWRDNLSEKVFRDTRTQIGILKSRGLTTKNLPNKLYEE